MQEAHRASIRVGFITILVIVILVGGYWGVRLFLDRNSSDEAAQTLGGQDSDSDGIPDVFEETYRTDPNKSDSDNDGVDDLEELVLGRDPAIAGPNDESKPLTGSNVTNLNTLTGKYLATLPENASRADILDNERIAAFIAIQQDELLPTIDQSEIKTIPETSAATVQTYLEAISASHNPEIKAITNEAIANAVSQQLQLQPGALKDLIVQLEQNNRTLNSVTVPVDLVSLHTRLLGASRALLSNVQLLAAIDEDFIGGLLAAQNIDKLGTTWQEIATDVTALEAQYKLE